MKFEYDQQLERNLSLEHDQSVHTREIYPGLVFDIGAAAMIQTLALDERNGLETKEIRLTNDLPAFRFNEFALANYERGAMLRYRYREDENGEDVIIDAYGVLESYVKVDGETGLVCFIEITGILDGFEPKLEEPFPTRTRTIDETDLVDLYGDAPVIVVRLHEGRRVLNATEMMRRFTLDYGAPVISEDESTTMFNNPFCEDQYRYSSSHSDVVEAIASNRIIY